MRLIGQRSETDCGICVAAMVAGVPWRRASETGPAPHARDGLTVNQFVSLVAQLDVVVTTSKSQYDVPLRDADVLPNTCAILIRKAGRSRGHFVAFSDGMVFDPDIGKYALDRYERKSWRVLRWFTLASK